MSKGLKILLCCVILMGCAGGPAAPPAPLVEIPSALSIPPSVGIDVSEVASGSSGNLPTEALSFGSQAAKALVGVGGEFSEDISHGADLATEINAVLDGILSPLHQLVIPVNPSLTQFQGVVTFNPGTTAEAVRTLQLNFADFDLNGDGSTEGCTGCTCPAGCGIPECPSELPASELRPICLRIWVEEPGSADRRLLAGIFNLLPTDSSPGIGQIRTQLELRNAAGDVVDTLFTAANFNHADPLALFTEFFFKNPLLDGTQSGSHINLRQTGAPASSKKTIQESTDFVAPDPANSSFFKSVVQFLENKDFVSLSVEEAPPPSTEPNPFFAQCALISTGNGIARENCLELGIDVGMPGDPGFIDFIRFATEGDVQFFDFPLLPPL
ncbi:MAG TPA: hypothetical protein DF383_01665 [Deltaproteobacteria bacterium]|nr:hypothetical protein [Deltaproteobacteria bacterium]